MNLRISINLITMLSVVMLSALVPSNAHANGDSQRRSSDQAATRQGLPGRRISGGTRSPGAQCVAADAQPLVAIIPDSNIGLTTKASPTLWFSVPAVHSTRHLEFGLLNQDNELIYQTQLSAPGQAGLVGIDLAKLNQAPTLETDKAYRWFLAVVCNNNNRSEDLWVDGWVQRTEQSSSLIDALASVSSSEMAQLYLEHGLWQESVDQILTDSLAQTNEFVDQSDWNWLLTAAGLESVAVTATPMIVPAVELQEIAQQRL